MPQCWKIGDSAKVSKTIDDAQIRQFAELTDDWNKLHFDQSFASGTRFQGRIAHGMLSASLISTVVGMHIPGPGNGIFLGQTLRFLKPVYPGDTVTVIATVIAVREDKPLLTLETIWTNQHGDRVIEGEAQVMLMEAADPKQ